MYSNHVSAMLVNISGLKHRENIICSLLQKISGNF